MRSILLPGRNCMDLYTADKSGLLVDARAYYTAFVRAAGAASDYILLAGWRFESRVRLLRGEDTATAGFPYRFLPFLRYLCRRNPSLRIYVLAWDFSFFFILEREWFLKRKFNRACDGRIRFLFDKVHPFAAAHHQKYAVIDGWVAFAGGMDFSAGHWDDIDHRPDNPDRADLHGKPYEACHDVQTYFSGPAVQVLIDHFLERWNLAGGGRPDLRPAREEPVFEPGSSHSFPPSRIALSRTAAKTIFPIHDSVEEIRTLFLDAIAASSSLIYIENQYFSSQAVFRALIDRMRLGGGKLQIVLVLPGKMHAYVEELSLGLTQMKMTRTLRQVAEETGHALGIYWTAADGATGGSTQTYIHSKVLLVDDHFLSIGSANTTNRSMGLDSELNISWEADPEGEKELARAIRRVRVKLMAEHAGLRLPLLCRRLYRIEGLVGTLDQLARTPGYRLRRYAPEYALGKSTWLQQMGAEELIIDPEKPVIAENVYEQIIHDGSGFLTKSILLLNRWIWGRGWKP